MHIFIKFGFLLFCLLFISCERSVSPYKMELQDNEIACLIDGELFNGELVFANLKKFDGYYQLEIDAFKDNNSIHCSIISDNDVFVGTYYFDKKTLYGLPYSTNNFKYLVGEEEENILYNSHYCDEVTGQVEITNFNLEKKTCSGFIHAKICAENDENDTKQHLTISECRFYNIAFQLVNK